jgi:hypothetical protein
MASMSKSLAQTNKSQDGAKATKRYRPEGDVREAKETAHFFHHRRLKRPSLICLPTKALAGQAHPAGPLSSVSFMTSDDRLSLILRRLDEIERKLDHMLDEPTDPHGHRLFGTPGQSSKK